MFVRADTLLSRGDSTSFAKHVVNFGWEGYVPLLLCYDQHNDRVEPLKKSENIDWNISTMKRCVGSFDENGYHRCPSGMPVKRFDQCSRCASEWIGHQECIFEPRCNGDLCDSEICRRTHTVYVAFFGESGKVGMTTSARLMERGIEQGADAIAPLARLPNRLEGRRAEQRISEILKLPQTTPRKKALKLLEFSSSRKRLEELNRAYHDTLAERMEVLSEPLQHLDGYPLKGLDRQGVELAETPGAHSGKVLGHKGKFMVYRTEKGELRAIEMADMAGRFVTLADKRF